MKKLLVFLTFFSFLCFQGLAQLPVNKPVKIILADEKYSCLQRGSDYMFTIAPYNELPTQEWIIVPANEPNIYYLQLATKQYLKFYSYGNFASFSFAYDSLRIDSIDRYKFIIKPTSENEWEISPKKNPNLFLQQHGITPNIFAEPKNGYLGTTFIIDTIPYRRPKPTLLTLKNSRCDAGVLKNLQTISVFGADATCFQPGGMYPAQFLLKIYLSADKKDRLEILVFDDVRRLRKKSYTIQENGPKNQPSIKVYVGDKINKMLNKGIIKLNMLVLTNNTFSLFVSEAANTTDELVNPAVYDIAVKGIYMLH